MELLRDLPEDQRAAIQGYVIDELSYAQLTVGANVSPAAMRKRVSRGLVTLRQRLTRQAERHRLDQRQHDRGRAAHGSSPMTITLRAGSRVQLTPNSDGAIAQDLAQPPSRLSYAGPDGTPHTITVPTPTPPPGLQP